MSDGKDLFSRDDTAFMPLAARMRPRTLADYAGQQHILGDGKPLYEALQQRQIYSLILWGPPGSGKTSFARLVSELTDSEYLTLSAVLSGVQDIKAAIRVAKDNRLQKDRSTILFIDEVHRFNKAQQDLFLPFIEDGTIIFIGATTENPSFEINNALLSRVRVYTLKELCDADLHKVLDRALTKDAELSLLNINLTPQARELMVASANGDARALLNLLESVVTLLRPETNHTPAAELMVSPQDVEACLGQNMLHFDKNGEHFYDQISALHKSIRGSDPDASLYWAVRMMEGGCDPVYIARRLLRIASEDIGNADLRAMTIAREAWEAFVRLGHPEGELAIAQAVVYLAVAPKSNAVYSAYKSVLAKVRASSGFAVPKHLRNAPTKLMKDEGYGDGYRYAHDEDGAFAAGESYFPQALDGTRFYYPVERGLEIKISEKLRRLRERNQQSDKKRYEGTSD